MSARGINTCEIGNKTGSGTRNSLPRRAHNWRNFKRENYNSLLRLWIASLCNGIAAVNPRI